MKGDFTDEEKGDFTRQFILEEMLDHILYQNQLKMKNYQKFFMQHIMHRQ